MTKCRLVLAAVLAAGVLTGLSAGWVVPAQAQETEREVHRVGDDVTPPRLTYEMEPEYTEEAREAKLEGVVVLCRFSGNGRASAPR